MRGAILPLDFADHWRILVADMTCKTHAGAFCAGGRRRNAQAALSFADCQWRVSRIALLLLLVTVVLAGCTSAPVARAPGDELVVSFEERPTMYRIISKRTGAIIIPGVDIFASGRCLLRTVDGEELERRLSPGDVQSLLKFLDGQGLFDISNESIERAIDREVNPVLVELPNGEFSVSGTGPVCVVDASRSRIVAHMGSKRVDISRYALGVEVEHYRAVTELRTVQNCIKKVCEVSARAK